MKKELEWRGLGWLTSGFTSSVITYFDPALFKMV